MRPGLPELRRHPAEARASRGRASVKVADDADGADANAAFAVIGVMAIIKDQGEVGGNVIANLLANPLMGRASSRQA